MDISKVISDAIDNVSYQTSDGMVDLKDPNHLYLVREELKKHLDIETVDSVLYLAEKVTSYKELLSDEEKEDSDITGFMDGNKWLYKEGPQGWKWRLDFAKLLKDASKLQKFEDFITKLPSGVPEKVAKTALSNFKTKKDRVDFVKNVLAEYTVPTKTMKYTSGVAKTLFELKPAGAGRGEIYLAAAVADSSIQGGNKSYDLEVGQMKYEVKDYSESESGPIRAGVEAAVSKFPFWNQILETVKVIQKIDAVDKALSPWELIPNNTTKQEIIVLKDKILKRVNGFYDQKKMKEISPKIVSGEFSAGDQRNFTAFYKAANSLIGVDDKGYNEVRFYGPNMGVVRFSITTTAASSLSNGKKVTLELLPESDQNRFELLKNYLSKLMYVRNPGGFAAGIQDAMNKIFTATAANADSWIIFRKSGMKILASDASNFEYKSISQNGVKFQETANAKST